jgi:RNA polymerase sigma-70 factor (ECF subfamily)
MAHPDPSVTSPGGSAAPDATGTAGPVSEAERGRAEALLRQHSVMLRAHLRHVLRSAADADDVAQEVCLIVLGDPRILLRGDDPGAYLRGMARHLAGRHVRRAVRSRSFEALVDLHWDGPTSDEPIGPLERERAQQRQTRAFTHCLEKIPERMRRVLDWKYRDGQTSLQIAARLATTAEAVRMALMRTRQALARCISEQLAAGGPHA